MGHLIERLAREELARLTLADPTSAPHLRVVDDECSATGGIAAAEKLSSEQPSLVIGHPCSNAAVAAAKVYARSQTPFLAIGPRHPDITAKPAGPAVFRIGGRDDREAAETVAVFAPILIGQRLAIVHDRTAYAKGLADTVAAKFRAHGVPDITIEPIVAGERDYAAVMARLKSAGVAAVYFAGFPAEAALIFDGLRKSGVVARFIGCGALAGLKRPWLTVMAPRPLDEDRLAAVIRQALAAVIAHANGGEDVASALSREFDDEGDEKGPSFMPQPYPVE